ncbi:MAG: hypothetical protein ACP5R0_05230 [Thermoplasmata archaeon]
MFPDEVITVSKKGKKEARNLIGIGKFVKYNYLDPETGRENEKKYRLILSDNSGIREEYFVLPTSDGKRFLMIPAQEKEERKIWDGKNIVDLDDLLAH